MMIYFEGQTEEWLLARRSDIQNAMANGLGAQTHVGMQSGVYHEFAALTQAQLEEQLRRVMYSLYLLDPDTYTNPYTQKVMKVSSQFPCSY